VGAPKLKPAKGCSSEEVGGPTQAWKEVHGHAKPCSCRRPDRQLLLEEVDYHDASAGLQRCGEPGVVRGPVLDVVQHILDVAIGFALAFASLDVESIVFGATVKVNVPEAF
jgi:hypothetical protein